MVIGFAFWQSWLHAQSGGAVVVAVLMHAVSNASQFMCGILDYTVDPQWASMIST